MKTRPTERLSFIEQYGKPGLHWQTGQLRSKPLIGTKPCSITLRALSNTLLQTDGFMKRP
jgi:hypothetical protein